MITSLPFIYSFFLIYFWLVHKFIYKTSFKLALEKYLITVSIVFFFFQSPIINSLCEIINCTPLGESSYMTNYLKEECYTSTHLDLIFYYVIPCFICFVFILPAIPFFIMWKNRKILCSEKMIYKIGFLLNGYDKDVFYW